MASQSADRRIERVPWSEEAARVLAPTFNHASAAEEFEEGLASGVMVLWKIGEDSYAITESANDYLFVWAYAGRDACGFVRQVWNAAMAAGIARIGFYTQRRGLARLLRPFNPILTRGEGFYLMYRPSEPAVPPA